MRFSFTAFFALMILIVGFTYAQTVIIPIETNKNAYVLRSDEKGILSVVYFDKKLTNREDYRLISGVYRQAEDISEVMASAYTTAGSLNLLEPAISVTHADGNHSLDLRYVSHRSEKISDDISLLNIVMKDPIYKFQVELFYKSYFKEDVIEQWCRITNLENSEVTLQKFASANVYLKAKGFWLEQFHGDWAKEMQPEETKLTHGIKTLDSKLGTRADLFQSSAFMISLNKPATEDEGTVFYGALEWSGNFRNDFELDPKDNLRVISGINNYASQYPLEPGKSFDTPPFLFTLSNEGKGTASRNIQHWARSYKLLDGNGTRMTMLNNWESTFFDFDQKKLSNLLTDTKKLGIDLFLLDDGWFGNKYPRNGDRAGLGDWKENRIKLPDGLEGLIKVANDNNVKFGIWIEPEMVNPKSELYEKHPEWIIKQPQREEYYMRNQLVLDLSNPKVQDFVYNIIDGLFTKNPGLSYIKWDCNSVIFNAYSPFLKNQSKLYVDYVFGLYHVFTKLRSKYPHVPMMLCSGGGGRVDYGALQYFTEFWPSDNTDPIERIFIQWSYSYFYPAIACANHVTNWGNQPLKFKTDVAMMGKLGFDIDVDKLNNSDQLFLKNAIATYNDFKPIVFQGDQYRLSDPYENNVASVAYIDEKKTHAIIFNYLVGNRFGDRSSFPIILKGLDSEKRYRLKELNLYPGIDSKIVTKDNVYSGEFLMKVGFNPLIDAKRTSVVIQLDSL